MDGDKESSRFILYNIDFLRGLAAIAILFWHYQHFYYPQAGINGVAKFRYTQPLFDYFSWFYSYGMWAVQFFWMLSGLVFFHVYATRSNVGAWEFFVNRFSRLYPLHFLMLCVVAILQILSWEWFGWFQIYPHNDAWHFFLNLFLASGWGFQQGFSFNAPIWSVSVEVLTYITFFVFLQIVGIRIFSAVLWFVISLVLYFEYNNYIFECMTFFALGGCINQLYVWIVKKNVEYLNIFISFVLLSAIFSLLSFELLATAVGVKWGVFPILIWLAVSLDGMGFSSKRAGLALGNITYSSYLIHVPVQIILIFIMDAFLLSRGIVNSPLFLLFYIFLVLCLAILAYRFIERPLQYKARKLFLN